MRNQHLSRYYRPHCPLQPKAVPHVNTVVVASRLASESGQGERHDMYATRNTVDLVGNRTRHTVL
jgi:hypothetical protein